MDKFDYQVNNPKNAPEFFFQYQIISPKNASELKQEIFANFYYQFLCHIKEANSCISICFNVEGN